MSDEPRFSLYDDSRCLWLQRAVYTPKTFCDKSRYPESFMVWGAVGLGFRLKLMLVNRTMKSADKQHMWEGSQLLLRRLKELSKEHSFDLQLDGAAPHRDKPSAQFIEGQAVFLKRWGRSRLICLSVEMCGSF
jgi:hypothetical protein